MADYENTQQSKWNFDGAELEAVFSLKANFILQMGSWDLESAFWTLRTIRMEIDAKLSRGKKDMVVLLTRKEEKEKEKCITEKESVDKLMGELEDERNNYLVGNKQDPKARTRFFTTLENFYMHICHLMKKHGLYFREGEDNTLAVLRR